MMSKLKNHLVRNPHTGVNIGHPPGLILFEDSGEFYVLLYGEEGELRAEFNTTKPHLRIRNRQHRDWTRFDTDAPYFACFTGEMQELVDAINEDREHLCNGERGRAALEILNAVFISSDYS